MRFNRIVLFTILSAFVLVLVACQGSVYSRMSGKTGLAYASMESCTDIDNTYKSGQWNPESYLLGTYVEQGGIPYPDRCSSNTLYEQYCDGVRREQTVQCPAGYACKTNACTSTYETSSVQVMPQNFKSVVNDPQYPTSYSSGAAACSSISKQCQTLLVSCHNIFNPQTGQNYPMRWGVSIRSCADPSSNYPSSCVYAADCAPPIIPTGYVLMSSWEPAGSNRLSVSGTFSTGAAACQSIGQSCSRIQINCRNYAASGDTWFVSQLRNCQSAFTTPECIYAAECGNPCGNGLPDPNEECDDTNRASGDGCSNMCKTEFQTLLNGLSGSYAWGQVPVGDVVVHVVGKDLNLDGTLDTLPAGLALEIYRKPSTAAQYTLLGEAVQLPDGGYAFLDRKQTSNFVKGTRYVYMAKIRGNSVSSTEQSLVYCNYYEGANSGCPAGSQCLESRCSKATYNLCVKAGDIQNKVPFCLTTPTSTCGKAAGMFGSTACTQGCLAGYCLESNCNIETGIGCS